jgi:ferredoxin
MRVKWTNEHIMAALFVVLLFYHLPIWVEKSHRIAGFLLLLFVGMMIDVGINFIRYKRAICAVSAAVTIGMLSILTQSVPLWGQLIGVCASLILGKHVFGGTGKNIINPAITGLLVIILLYDIPYPFFTYSVLFIPAVILSIPFIKMRPYASISFMIGMLLAMVFNQTKPEYIITYGMVFFGCFVMTDPVTVTIHPIIGSITGFIIGFTTIWYPESEYIVILGVLGLNIISYVADRRMIRNVNTLKPKFTIPKIISYQYKDIQAIDLSDTSQWSNNHTVVKNSHIQKNDMLASLKVRREISKNNILQKIKDNEVFGMGGGAYSTYQKIMTVINTSSEDKHFIINGVECDPGLIHDYWLLRTCIQEICMGIEAVSACVNFKSLTIAVKDSKDLDYHQIEQTHCKIKVVSDTYPMGAERILIREVLNKQLGGDEIPATKGILVLNVQTMYSIYEAVYHNKKADTRFLTVANLKECSAKVVKVRLGMKLNEIMEKIYPGAFTVFAGGGFMQSYLSEEDTVVDEKVNYIANAEFPRYKESPLCSHCGRCTLHCPAGLQVKEIVDLMNQGKIIETKKYHADHCISCGSCSYTCLAGRNLSAKVMAAKKALQA